MMIKYVQNECEPLYEALANPIYERLTTINAIQSFMELHIYSVWDFMNLLKFLQTHFTCTSTPAPYKTPKLTRLINEIVLKKKVI